MQTRFVLTLGAAVLLGGCFDVQYDVTLKNDGGGAITTRIVYDKDMTGFMAQNGNKPKTQQSNILLNGKPVLRDSTMQDGRLVEVQVANFTRLADLTLPENGIEVTDLGRSLWGVDTSRVRVNFGKPDAAASKPGEESPEAKKMIAQMMNGHFLTMTLHLPCNVETANTLTMQGSKIAPAVDKSWLHGSTVTWQIPMALVFTSGNKEAPKFDVVCWSWMGIPAGKTKG